MRTKFDQELLALNRQLIRMGALCQNAIAIAVDAFVKGEADVTARTREVEGEIDEMEKAIEQQCLRLLLQQQPVAKDLRMISAALKMITDLERIGDQAEDIAELCRYTHSLPAPAHIREMAQEAVKMVTEAIDSFVTRDLALANAVIQRDDVVDTLFMLAKKDIILTMQQEHADPEALIDILMISKYLERIADHATNIAEWVVFSITGKHEEG